MKQVDEPHRGTLLSPVIKYNESRSAKCIAHKLISRALYETLNCLIDQEVLPNKVGFFKTVVTQKNLT